MRPKAYVPGVVALLAALLAGCTGSDGDGGGTDDRPVTGGTTAPPAQPGRYRTLPEPCRTVSEDSLDTLLPGIEQITDEEQRETAYEGEPTQTFDTDRRVGCRWRVESATATNRLLVDFERVVAYANGVSDDSRAEEVYTVKETDADLPEPSAPPTEETAGTGGGDGSDDGGTESADGSTPSGSSTPSTPSSTATLQPRVLDGLGDQAFLNDELSQAQQRTVTVVFRTSNVIVTVSYVEQPASTRDVPDSEEMQDRARNLAERLADSLDG